jgi:hypothetical protein
MYKRKIRPWQDIRNGRKDVGIASNVWCRTPDDPMQMQHMAKKHNVVETPCKCKIKRWWVCSLDMTKENAMLVW